MLDEIFENVDDFAEYNMANNICEECDQENCICDDVLDDVDDYNDEDNDEF